MSTPNVFLHIRSATRPAHPAEPSVSALHVAMELDDPGLVRPRPASGRPAQSARRALAGFGRVKP